MLTVKTRSCKFCSSPQACIVVNAIPTDAFFACYLELPPDNFPPMAVYYFSYSELVCCPRKKIKIKSGLTKRSILASPFSVMSASFWFCLYAGAYATSGDRVCYNCLEKELALQCSSIHGNARKQ